MKTFLIAGLTTLAVAFMARDVIGNRTYDIVDTAQPV